MVRTAVVLVSAVFLMAGAGCAICSSEFDDDYAAFGGSWDRHNRSGGRVGSAFDPAGDRVAYGTSQTLDEQDADEAPGEAEEAMEGPLMPDSGEPSEDAASGDR